MGFAMGQAGWMEQHFLRVVVFGVSLLLVSSGINQGRRFVGVLFVGRGMEFIDLHSVFRDDLVISSIPGYFNNSGAPVVCYKFGGPIGYAVFDFNKIVTDVDIDFNTPDSWDCQGSNCLYPSAGRLVAGNLGVISDARVHSIVSRGPKYRFPSGVGFPECRRGIAASLSGFGDRWCRPEGVGLVPWGVEGWHL